MISKPEWVPHWATHYKIDSDPTSLLIKFYAHHRHGCMPVEQLASTLAIEDVKTQIRQHHEKQARYTDEKGKDWIDEFFDNSTKEEFDGAMAFTIGKYIRRLGKKDARAQELKKIADYAYRWWDKERGR